MEGSGENEERQEVKPSMGGGITSLSEAMLANARPGIARIAMKNTRARFRRRHLFGVAMNIAVHTSCFEGHGSGPRSCTYHAYSSMTY